MDKAYAKSGQFMAASKSLILIAQEGNDRLTINQAAFFFIAATADTMGRPMTPSEIFDEAKGALTKSIKNTYKVLLEDHREYRDIALGWLRAETDDLDNRRKLLRLTAKGRSVAERFIEQFAKDV
ncbi:hypothetical protein [Novosphingobium jiangmenense]|uniref:HTH marR-type domain-containing protein n=1 Tax=Novosphingobium jiangmenense TaxID=2791981 RepID=A0ABS0HHL3_9SPHN|nr:hypothetical protein [Novosphingobium jiangmenense]MBF9151741.1 hypothetical protein [Novosphingobium jiangmenense]